MDGIPQRLATYTSFIPNAIQNLTEADFKLGSEFGIELNIKDCMLILFYGEDSASQELCKTWASVSAQIAGPKFAACNVVMQPRVRQAFFALLTDTDHVFHNFGLSHLPAIIVYRKGLPRAFYSGDLTIPELSDYALTLACFSDYREEPMLDPKRKTSSRDFRAPPSTETSSSTITESTSPAKVGVIPVDSPGPKKEDRPVPTLMGVPVAPAFVPSQAFGSPQSAQGSLGLNYTPVRTYGRPII